MGHVINLETFGADGLPRRRFWRADPDRLNAQDSDEKEGFTPVTQQVPADESERANLVGSRLEGSDLHAPAIDLDVPARYVPSSTPGHGHLYIDVPMTWEEYQDLLRALERVGVIESGFLRASVARGQSFLRTPWTKKQSR